MRILIIEDDNRIAKPLAEYLKRHIITMNNIKLCFDKFLISGCVIYILV